MQSGRNPGLYDTTGAPLAVPGAGDIGVPTVFSGAVKDVRNDSALFREDQRQVITNFDNLVLDAGKEFVVLDIAEAGELHSVVIVSDNPYMQAYLQIDDFRNQEPYGVCAAELLYNGGVTTLSQKRFTAVDGQSPTVGYGLVFEPQEPVKYTERLRIVVRNTLKANQNIYGKDLNFRNSASLPTPAVPAHMAGSSFEQGSLASLSLNQLAQAMTTPIGSPAYYSGQTYNHGAISGQILSGMQLGTDHPYVGLAGKPIFNSDPSSEYIPKEVVGSSTRDAPYRLKLRDAAERFPGTLNSYSSMIVDILPQIGEGGTLDGTSAITDASFNTNMGFGIMTDGTRIGFDITHDDFPVDKRMFYRVGGEVAMLGVCTAISATIQNETDTGTHGELLPSNGSTVIGHSNTDKPTTNATKDSAGAITGTFNHTYADKSGSHYYAPEFHLKIEPGLAGKTSDFTAEVDSSATLTNGFTATTEYARWGTLTSAADTNPQILVKKIDVRRRKVYSKEG